jgi:hypothetical protein
MKRRLWQSSLIAKKPLPSELISLIWTIPNYRPPVETDHKTAAAIINDTCKQIHSKSIAMHFYWVHECIKQGPFIVYWAPRKTNKADYFTKHHQPAHLRHIRFDYLHKNDKHSVANPSSRTQDDAHQGCVELPTKV